MSQDGDFFLTSESFMLALCLPTTSTCDQVFLENCGVCMLFNIFICAIYLRIRYHVHSTVITDMNHHQINYSCQG